MKLCDAAQAGSRNNHRLPWWINSHHLANQGIPRATCSSCTRAGVQALPSSGRGGSLPPAGTCLSRVHAGTVFTTVLWSSQCLFDLLCTEAGSSSASNRMPLSLPNTSITYTQMCYLANTQVQIVAGTIYVLSYITTPQTLRVPSCKVICTYLQSSLLVFSSDPIPLDNLPLLTPSSQQNRSKTTKKAVPYLLLVPLFLYFWSRSIIWSFSTLAFCRLIPFDQKWYLWNQNNLST